MNEQVFESMIITNGTALTTLNQEFRMTASRY